MKSKTWLKESISAYVTLKKIVLDKRPLNDLKYLTDFNHTGGTLEVYHIEKIRKEISNTKTNFQKLRNLGSLKKYSKVKKKKRTKIISWIR